jgi:hypothetical protein
MLFADFAPLPTGRQVVEKKNNYATIVRLIFAQALREWDKITVDGKLHRKEQVEDMMWELKPW